MPTSNMGVEMNTTSLQGSSFPSSLSKPAPHRNENPEQRTQTLELPKSITKSLKFVDDYKGIINTGVHIVSSTVNFFTFLNGNFKFISLDDETSEKVSNFCDVSSSRLIKHQRRLATFVHDVVLLHVVSLELLTVFLKTI